MIRRASSGLLVLDCLKDLAMKLAGAFNVAFIIEIQVTVLAKELIEEVET